MKVHTMGWTKKGWWRIVVGTVVVVASKTFLHWWTRTRDAMVGRRDGTRKLSVVVQVPALV